jgi:hypothetical protein
VSERLVYQFESGTGNYVKLTVCEWPIDEDLLGALEDFIALRRRSITRRRGIIDGAREYDSWGLR